MKFFFPDSRDVVDPSFDFDLEVRSPLRIRHRSESYAHESFKTPAYDGLLLSKALIDGFDGNARYSIAQRHRLLRVGAPEFMRTTCEWGRLPIMGDCGAFAYVREHEPPYSVEDVIHCYAECKFDFGLSVDHVILAYQPSWDSDPETLPPDIRQRQALTLQLAAEFLSRHRKTRPLFQPIGVAQGWSPQSYARAVNELQSMGYGYIALGGMVGLKSSEILDCLRAIDDIRDHQTGLHLLGVTRTDHVSGFAAYGVISFDSTSPLKQAFKSDKDNFYTLDRTYSAIRIPQVEGNRQLQQRIISGGISQDRARRLEKRCLELFMQFDADKCSLEELLEALREYELLYDSTRDHTTVYREVLMDQPWKKCPCEVCRQIGYHVILFRGAERNRRRGFHNVWVFYRRLQRQLGLNSGEGRVQRVALAPSL